MTTYTIEIPEKGKKTLTDLVAQLGGKIVAVDKIKKLSKTDKKQQLLNDLEESVKFIKLHQAGKVEARSMAELLNEL